MIADRISIQGILDSKFQTLIVNEGAVECRGTKNYHSAIRRDSGSALPVTGVAHNYTQHHRLGAMTTIVESNIHLYSHAIS